MKLNCHVRVVSFGLGLILSSSACCMSRDGIYAGIGLGGVSDQFDLTTRNTATGYTITSPTSSASSFLGSVFVGYGTTLVSGLYLAGELGTDYPRRQTTINNRPGVTLTNYTFSNALRVQDYVTFDGLVGYRVNESWLAYARLGLSYSNLSLYQPAIPITPAFNFSDSAIAGRIGAGINYGFSQNLGFGLDYIYMTYQENNAYAWAYNTSYKQQVSSNYVGISIFYTI